MGRCLPGHDDWHFCSSTPYEHCATCCREVNSFRARAKDAHLRQEVLDAYGRFCVCCGEDTEVFLVIDHVDGGGNAHRREIGSHGLYYWLKRSGWPTGFQTLCHNCNHAKHVLGVCPHQGGLDSVAAACA